MEGNTVENEHSHQTMQIKRHSAIIKDWNINLDIINKYSKYKTPSFRGNVALGVAETRKLLWPHLIIPYYLGMHEDVQKIKMSHLVCARSICNIIHTPTLGMTCSTKQQHRQLEYLNHTLYITDHLSVKRSYFIGISVTFSVYISFCAWGSSPMGRRELCL